MTTRDPLQRVKSRPSPGDWADDAPMRLEEIVAVFSAEYPISVSALRTEIRHGRLVPARVAGKFFVTPGQLRALFTPAASPMLDRPKENDDHAVRVAAAQAAARVALERLRAAGRTKR